jgi:hypothetical protein
MRGGGADALFQWFAAALLVSARIKSPAGLRAVGALLRAGLASAAAVADAPPGRVRALLRASGYDRYEEKAAGFLFDDARELVVQHGGRAAAAVWPETLLNVVDITLLDTQSAAAPP